MSSKLLINEPPLQVLPTLAKTIGLNDSIFLQQLHYWLSNPKIGTQYDGKKWVRNTIKEWQEENFPFWHKNTITKIAKRLTDSGIVLTKKLKASEGNQTLYYTIDYEALDHFTRRVNSESTQRVKSIHTECEILESTQRVKSNIEQRLPKTTTEKEDPSLENASTTNSTNSKQSVSGNKRSVDPLMEAAAKRNGYQMNGNGKAEKHSDDPESPDPKVLTALAHEYERLAKVEMQIEAEMKANRKQESSTRRIVREKAEALYHLGYKEPEDYAAVESALFGKTANLWKVYDKACMLANGSESSPDALITIKPGLYGGYTDEVLWDD